MVTSPNLKNALAFTEKILERGITGKGPFKGSQQIADEALKYAHGDAEKAIKRVVQNHSAMVTTAGFVAGVGGLPFQVIAMPADLTAFYVYAVRMVGAIAILRGFDADSDEIRTAISVSLVGAFGSEGVTKMGIKFGNRAATAALKKLPGKVLQAINQKVGFKLLTKFGEKGVINLGKGIPFVGAGVGAGMNAISIHAIAGYALFNFPAFDPMMEDELLTDDDGDGEIIDVEIIED